MHDNDEFDEADLQALRDRAKALPRDIAPPPEAWANIRDRIEHSRVRELTPRGDVAVAGTSGAHTSTRVVSGGVHAPAPSRLLIPRMRLVVGVAAALFIAVTVFVVRREGVDETRIGTVAAALESLPQPDALLASPSIALVFAQYDEATSDLTKDLEQRRSRLQPEAVAVIDSCLTTIDRAIKESRTALTEAPDNTTIAELLQLTYQQKIDLLRRAAELPLGSL